MLCVDGKHSAGGLNGTVVCVHVTRRDFEFRLTFTSLIHLFDKVYIVYRANGRFRGFRLWK